MERNDPGQPEERPAEERGKSAHDRQEQERMHMVAPGVLSQLLAVYGLVEQIRLPD